MAGADPRTPLSLRDDVGCPEPFTALNLKGLKIGWMADYAGYLATEPGVLELCELGLKLLGSRRRDNRAMLA
jgi:amidase